MKLQQFQLKTKTGTVVKGEYEGNEKSGKCIIFSHGFGVTRDSHGMFNELGDLLKQDFLVVRFDYALVNKKENYTKVFPLSVQAEMLQEVVKYVEQGFKPETVNIIAHSIGCLIVGLAQLANIDRILLLAGPVTPPYQRLKEYFSQRPESKINEQAMSKIKRSDGSLTYVEKDIWKQTRDIDPIELYSNLTKNSDVMFIRALSDQVVIDTDYEIIKSITGLQFKETEGSHDFEGKARVGLKQIVQDFFV
jgi:hypothetical protein